MRINEDYTVSSVCGKNIVVCQGTLDQDMTQIISLNETAVELWHHFEERDFTLEEVAAYLCETYGLKHEQALSDAQRWAERLTASKAIEA